MLKNKQTSDFLYTAAITVSQKDIQKIRERLDLALSDCVDVIKQSDEEELACLCIDFKLL